MTEKESKYRILQEKFNEAYNKANFHPYELMGFRHDPRLAVLAGMAIGYKLALTDFQTKEIKENEP